MLIAGELLKELSEQYIVKPGWCTLGVHIFGNVIHVLQGALEHISVDSWPIHLIPCFNGGYHPFMPCVTVLQVIYPPRCPKKSLVPKMCSQMAEHSSWPIMWCFENSLKISPPINMIVFCILNVLIYTTMCEIIEGVTFCWWCKNTPATYSTDMKAMRDQTNDNNWNIRNSPSRAVYNYTLRISHTQLE